MAFAGSVPVNTAFFHQRSRSRPLAGWLGCLLWLGFCVSGLFAQTWEATGPVTVRSRSDQFMVTAPGVTPAPVIPSSGNFRSRPLVRLDAPTLAASCERIKQTLLHLLQTADQWHSRIFLKVRPVTEPGELIYVQADFTEGGWMYRLDVPSSVEPGRLLRAVTQVLLQEMANRHAQAQPGELPPWLTEGVAAHLWSVNGASLIIEGKEFKNLTPDDLRRGLRIDRRGDPLRGVRERLDRHPALTWEELNWPTDDQLNSCPEGIYADCAHLFVYQLLRLRDGPALLQQMLAGLPRHLNWQTTFLEAFQPHFKSLRDADKWWLLLVSGLTGRDLIQSWSLNDSWEKLQDVLAAPVEVRQTTNSPATRERTSLQAIISGWPFARQKPVLRNTVAQLHALRLRVAPSLLTLTDDYRLGLEQYLSKRSTVGTFSELKGAVPGSAVLLARDTVRHLDQLDVIREDLRLSMAPTAASRAGDPAAVLPR
jgi:hypothetical protein